MFFFKYQLHINLLLCKSDQKQKIKDLKKKNLQPITLQTKF